MLLTLSRVNKTHIAQLTRMINSTYNEVKRNLKILENEGIVEITLYGNMKIVELQRDNQKTGKLLKALVSLQTNSHEPVGRDTEKG
jgi:predicted transcriptional regulator